MKNISKKMIFIIIIMLLAFPSLVKADNELGILDEQEKVLLEEEIEQSEEVKEGLPNDINGDRVVDNSDVVTLEDNILKEDYKEEVKDNLDINNDENVDIKDLVVLDDIVNNQDLKGETTDSNFKIKTKQKDNLITYDVYLETDGVVRSFIFDLEKTDNLKLKEVKPSDDVLFYSSDFLRLIGLGNFNNNNLLASIYYEISGYNAEIISLTNSMIVYDNGNYKESLEYKNIFRLNKPVKKRTKKIQNYQDNLNNTSYYLPIIKESKKSNQDIKEKDDKDSTSTKEEDNSKENITNKKKKTKKKDDEKTKEISVKNIYKVALIVLIGALIIYLLNSGEEKEDEEE